MADEIKNDQATLDQMAEELLAIRGDEALANFRLGSAMIALHFPQYTLAEAADLTVADREELLNVLEYERCERLLEAILAASCSFGGNAVKKVVNDTRRRLKAAKRRFEK